MCEHYLMTSVYSWFWIYQYQERWLDKPSMHVFKKGIDRAVAVSLTVCASTSCHRWTIEYILIFRLIFQNIDCTQKTIREWHNITTIYRLNLVKIWFSENTFFVFFFTGRAFIIVNYIIKLVLEFQFDLQNLRKQPKLWTFKNYNFLFFKNQPFWLFSGVLEVKLKFQNKF